MTNASVLYQIFYQNNKFDFQGYLDKTAPKMLSIEKRNILVEDVKQNRTNPLQDMSVKSIEENKMERMKEIQSYVVDTVPTASCSQEEGMKVIIPEPKNTLFWSVFIGNYGYDEYVRVSRHYLNREMEEKQKIVSALSSNKRMKGSSCKLTNVAVQEILADLSLLKQDAYSALVAYCVFYNKHIYLLFGQCYLEFHPTTDCSEEIHDMENTIVLNLQPTNICKHKTFGVLLNMTHDDLTDMLNKRVRLEHFNKPIRGISAYKSNELEDMLSKIGFTSEKKVTKTEMYSILEKCASEIAV